MKIYKIEINGRTFDIIQDTDGKFIRPEVNGGTALKPAAEYIVMARKPLSEKTIVDNVIKWEYLKELREQKLKDLGI